jgi:hypothetical protein
MQFHEYLQQLGLWVAVVIAIVFIFLYRARSLNDGVPIGKMRLFKG